MNNEITSGIVSGVAAGLLVAITLWLWRQWVQWKETEVFKPTLPASLEEIEPEVKFGVLHHCNDDGTIINKVYRFKKRKGGDLRAAIRHPRNLGFQYKCFVDYTSTTSADDIIKKLEEKGCIHVSSGGGKPNRVWFILPSPYDKFKNSSGIINNIFYPE